MHFVYIVECKDTTLYIGSTNNLKRRLHEHNATSKGARYTKTRRPVILRYSEKFRTITKAMRREYALKRLPRAKKLLLFKV